MNKEHKCANCQYYCHPGGDIRNVHDPNGLALLGHCRLNPPSMRVHGNMNMPPEFPEVSATMTGCGQYKQFVPPRAEDPRV